MMAKETAPVEIRTYEEASNILRNFTKNSEWLRNLVWKYAWQYTGRTLREAKWPLGYKELLAEGKRIKGVALRMLKTSPRNKDLVAMIEAEKNLSGETLAEVQMRTASAMDYASHEMLRDLTLIYGKEVMGGYAQ